jgi:hypothetical protein
MRNTADVTGGKPIAVLLQSISGVSAINLLVAFYDIHEGKREAILLFCPGHHTRRSLVLLRKLKLHAISYVVYFVFYYEYVFVLISDRNK